GGCCECGVCGGVVCVWGGRRGVCGVGGGFRYKIRCLKPIFVREPPRVFLLCRVAGCDPRCGDVWSGSGGGDGGGAGGGVGLAGGAGFWRGWTVGVGGRWCGAGPGG